MHMYAYFTNSNQNIWKTVWDSLNEHPKRFMGQFTALHFLIQKQNRCKTIMMAKCFIDNKAPQAEKLSV